MAEAKRGDTVRVQYTGRLESGKQFAGSTDREPLQFTIGKGNIIPGFQDAVIGMQLGDSKTTTVQPEEAYGPHLEQKVVQVEKNRIAGHLKPEAGQQLELTRKDGHRTLVTVTHVSESSVTLDWNHPLAGKELTFDIQLLEIL